MIVGRVIGELVSTHKHPSHDGMKLLVVAPEKLADQPALGVAPAALIALDAAGAGVGERVLVVLDGFAAMTAVGRLKSPIDAAVIGIVDSVALSGEPMIE